MRKLSVPYTINRRGVYYLNLRWNNQFIRQSLATKDHMEAFEKVSQLASLISNPQTCAETLRHQVSEIAASGKRQNGSALRLVQTDEPSILLSQGFSLYKKEQILENWGLRTAAYNRAEYVDRRRDIMDWWSKRVSQSRTTDLSAGALSITEQEAPQ